MKWSRRASFVRRVGGGLGILAGTLSVLLAATLPTVQSAPAKAPPATVAAVPVQRDWKASPAIMQVDEPHDIYAVGDIHGDYEKAARLLVGAKFLATIPAQPGAARWSAGTGTLVCTGDMIDKGPQSLEVLQLMRALQADAEKQGGRVVVLLGNHEAEFLAAAGGDKKAADFQQELETRGISPADLAAGRDTLGVGAWLRQRPMAARVNDWFFCHAGNTGGLSVRELETAVETGVAKEGFGTFVLAQPNSFLEAKMSGMPWWMMPGVADAAAPAASAPDAAAQPVLGAARLRQYAAALGCKHLVVGHHPGKVDFGATTTRAAYEPFAYEGVLFMIDVGLSRGVHDGRGVVLHIPAGTPERAGVIDETGKETNLWTQPNP